MMIHYLFNLSGCHISNKLNVTKTASPALERKAKQTQKVSSNHSPRMHDQSIKPVDSPAGALQIQ